MDQGQGKTSGGNRKARLGVSTLVVFATSLLHGAARAEVVAIGDAGGVETSAVDAGTADGGAGIDVDELAQLKERVRILEERLNDESRVNEAARKDGDNVKAKVKELTQAIQFSGFFDVTVSTYRNNPNIFELGDFEFDIKKEYYKYFQVGAALVFADKQADLAVGFIDFHLFGGLIPARGNVFLESGFHLQVGKFDVTIGNDWQYYASLDRSTISAPLTTKVLMEGGYNDVGFRVLGNSGVINYAGYVLKGSADGMAIGGRLALVPFNNPFTTKGMDAQPIDLGVAYLDDLNQDGDSEQQTFAADLEARYDFLRVQAEYYWRKDLLLSLRRTGYQVSLFGGFLDDGPVPFGVYARFDHIDTRPDDGSPRTTLKEITAGAFFRPFEVTVLKLEVNRLLEGDEELHGTYAFAQLVIGYK
jgi:hypothetical protein